MKKTIAIITGATGGLGKAFTKHLITDVDEVWAIGRNIEKLKALEDSLDSRPIEKENKYFLQYP